MRTEDQNRPRARCRRCTGTRFVDARHRAEPKMQLRNQRGPPRRVLASDGDGIERKRRRLVGGGLRACRRGSIAPQRQVHREHCALPLRAFYVDAAAHQIDETPAQREPEAGAAEAAADRIVGLHERLKDARLPTRGNADARIGDGQHHHFAAVGRARHRRAQRYRTALRKLAGVAEQIRHDLRDPEPIAVPAAADRRIDEAQKIQSLACDGGCKRLRATLDHLIELKRLDMQAQLARFGLRQIEHVVDEREQRVECSPD